jgi:hypothetical protein
LEFDVSAASVRRQPAAIRLSKSIDVDAFRAASLNDADHPFNTDPRTNISDRPSPAAVSANSFIALTIDRNSNFSQSASGFGCETALMAASRSRA